MPPFSINTWTQRFNLDILPMFGIQLVETCSVIPPPPPPPHPEMDNILIPFPIFPSTIPEARSFSPQTYSIPLSPSPLHPICQYALPLLLCKVLRFCCFLSVSSGSALVRTLLSSPLAAVTAASSYSSQSLSMCHYAPIGEVYLFKEVHFFCLTTLIGYVSQMSS